MSVRTRSQARPLLILEELESRTLLSASSLDALVATPQIVLPPASQGSASIAASQGQPAAGTLTPSQIQTAYGFNQIYFKDGTIKGDGSGQTIAIVDAYNAPHIFSDLNTFDRTFSVNGTQSLYEQYGASKSFLTQVNQNGGTQLPQTDPIWSAEISLDVEWAHAIAPGAKILLVEANTSNHINLFDAVNYAKNASVDGQPVSVVSMSWGANEMITGPSELTSDSAFTTSSNNVTFVAASGDFGKLPSGLWYPAASPNVVAVGGTQLTLQNNSGTYGSETGWSYSTGGYSLYEKRPGYQKMLPSPSTAKPNGKRMNPDVAYAATNIPVYDTVRVPVFGGTGWLTAAGTSAGAPQWAALMAIADQGRALHDTGSLASSGTLYALW